MWHWTTRTGQYPEAVAFTRRANEPEPTFTEQVPEPEDIPRPTSAEHFDLAG